MEFKVGDKVRVRRDLEVDKRYGNDSFVYGMKNFKGNIVTISSDCGHHFEIKEDGGEWNWTPEMFESIKNNRVIFKDNATILFKDGKKYVAKCCDGDTYDREKGLLVCLAKAHGYTFNDLQEMLESAEEPKGKVREVKRKAKVGEYIKVVKTSGLHDAKYYNIGDILKVLDSDEDDGCIRATLKNTPKGNTDDNYNFLFQSEYVVLENYKPNKYKITLSKFWKSKRVMCINCKTKTEAKKLLKAFDRVGQKWSTRDSYLYEDNWEKNKEKTCYYNYNTFGCLDLVRKGCEVYNFNEVDLNN